MRQRISNTSAAAGQGTDPIGVAKTGSASAGLGRRIHVASWPVDIGIALAAFRPALRARPDACHRTVRARHAHQVSRGDFPREPLVRRLLCYLSICRQSARRARIPAATGHAVGERPYANAHRAQPELVAAVPHGSHPVLQMRPGSRLHG